MTYSSSGRGPTGLAPAAALQRYGVRFRIVDRALDRVRESRAPAIQPRTLEVQSTAGHLVLNSPAWRVDTDSGGSTCAVDVLDRTNGRRLGIPPSWS